jgi:predicted DNA-binding transcriptional regulator YafY
MDHISNMSIYEKPAVPIADVKGYRGAEFHRIAATLPYMYTDAPERIEFIADEQIVDQVVDWFGKDVKMAHLPDCAGKVKVEILSSPSAMEHWALQYRNHVEVTKPESLRERIKEALQNGIKKY